MGGAVLGLVAEASSNGCVVAKVFVAVSDAKDRAGHWGLREGDERACRSARCRRAPGALTLILGCAFPGLKFRSRRWENAVRIMALVASTAIS